MQFYAKVVQTRKTIRNFRGKYIVNVDISVVNQVTYVTKSVRNCGSKLWNSLPHHQIKSAGNLGTVEE